MKNLKLRKGKVAIMGLAIFILMFSILFSTNIPEYSEKAVKNEPKFFFQDIQASADPSSFISVWSANEVTLPLESGGIYDFTVFWGDGNNDTITDWDQTEVTHTYISAGLYEINITGTIVGWRFNNGGDKLRLIEISQWGNLSLGNSGSYFWGCANLKITATDILNLTGTTNLYSTFKNCAKLGSSGNLGGWDVSSVTNMDHMFYGATGFNQNIGGWNVSSVTDMNWMFGGETAFNQDIAMWNVSRVTGMSFMFLRATAFNQDIGEWDVSSVTVMDRMFYDATAFNQNIGGWNVSSVTDMGIMFRGAEAFNQDIGGWDVSGVTNMHSMFARATAFNQDINGWNVSRVTDMSQMFHSTTVFNQDIGGWDVSSVTNMQAMFNEAMVFNQDIGGWNVSAVTDMQNMFFMLAHDNYDSLLNGWANLSLQSGVYFSAGNSAYSSAATAARQYIIDTHGWNLKDNGLIESLNIPVLITSSQTIIKENITIEWNNVEHAASYNIYVNGTINETTQVVILWSNGSYINETSQVVMLWSNGNYSITVTSANGIFESDESEPIIIVVDLTAGNEGETPTIPGYNFTLIPTMLLGLVMLTLKIRNKKKNCLNQY
jgi:surface protein